MLTPPLKWAGGKRWLTATLQKLYRPELILNDLFAGGLSVSLGLDPKEAVVNDINPHLINFYRHIQNGLVIDIELLNDRDFYINARGEFNNLIATGQQDSKLAAILFYYLNRNGFNGLCRFNKKGFFNVPFGAYKTVNFQKDFLNYQKTLSKWTFSSKDFEEVPIKPNHFVYFDPPYDVEFTSYSSGGFNWDDQVRLANYLASYNVPMVGSNQATPRILKLYSDLGFTVETVLAPRRVNCTGDRTPAKEMLATRNLDVATLYAQATTAELNS